MNDTVKMAIIGLVCFVVGIVGGNYILQNNGGSGGIDEEHVRGIVAEYVASNPEKIVESLQGMQAKAAADQQAQMQEAMKENLPALKAAGDSPVAGDVNSSITLVEFFDYNCGYCKRMSGTLQAVLEAHPDIKVIFKEFPILSESSQLAAQAALAVNTLKPAKYLEYHMMLMKHKGQYDMAALKDYAGQVQVDLAAFEKEMNGERVMKELQSVQDLAAKAGIQGTPAIIIGDELIPGAIPFADLDARIKALKEK